MRTESSRENRTLSTALVILCLSLVRVDLLYSQKPIPEGKLGYPILVELPTRLPASGFFLRDEGVLWLVTAGHVLFDTTGQLWAKRATLTAYTGDPSDSGFSVLQIDLEQLNKRGLVLKHSTHDVAVAGIALDTVFNGRTAANFDKSVAVVKLDTIGLYPVERRNTKSLNEVQVANEVVVLGYPTALGIQNLPQQFDHRRPLLRKGIVAGKNATLGTLIIDCPTYKGNSGSPVIEIERSFVVDVFKVVGVVTEFIPFDERWVNREFGLVMPFMTNSGYSVVVPMDRVFELTRSK
jgi:V8-like Glu-specific endopeptidase